MATQANLTRVLVPLDGSTLAEQAIPVAAAVAGSAELIFLQVLSAPEPLRDPAGRVSVPADDVEAVLEERAQHELTAAAGNWRGVLSGTPRLLTARGDITEQILHVAQREGCDLIVAASHGRGAIARLAFGSVADRLSRSSTVPVLIVRPRDADAEIVKPEFDRIVVPYDGSELAAEAFPIAIAFAKTLGCGVHIVRAISPAAYAPFPTTMEPMASATVYESILATVEEEGNRSLAEAASEFSGAGINVTQALVNGAPADAIERETQPGDLIVMTSHGRSGMGRWLLGSVAEKLVRQGPTPVVLVPSSARAGAA